MQVGTLSGNPVASVAGLKTLEILRRPGQYQHLRDIGATLMRDLSNSLDAVGVAHRIVGHETLFDVVFTDRPVRDYRDTLAGDQARLTAFNQVLRREGLFKAPSKLYPSLAVTDADLTQSKEAFATAATALIAA